MKTIISLFTSCLLLATVSGKWLEIQNNREDVDTDQPKTCNCGTSSPEKIVNGQHAANGEIPWQVSFQRRRGQMMSFFCGGSIISEWFVLTAAHCLNNTDIDVVVFSGEVNLIQSYAGVVSPIAWIKQHERYNRDTTENDICLVRLAARLTFTNRIRPVCLPTQQMLQMDLTQQVVQISGYGAIKEGGPSSTELLKSSQIVVSNDECKLVYRNSVKDTNICAYYLNTDTCQGDSGGPLTFYKRGYNYLVGVVSFGRGCARPGIPGVYARVTSFMSWILAQTGSLCSN